MVEPCWSIFCKQAPEPWSQKQPTPLSWLWKSSINKREGSEGKTGPVMYTKLSCQVSSEGNKSHVHQELNHRGSEYMPKGHCPTF